MSEHIDVDPTPPMGFRLTKEVMEQLEVMRDNDIRATAKLDNVDAATEEFQRAIDAIAEGKHVGMKAELQNMNASALQRGASLAVRQTTSMQQMPPTQYGIGDFTNRF